MQYTDLGERNPASSDDIQSKKESQREGVQ